MPYMFLCICEYWQEKFWRMAHDLPNLPIFPPTKIFLCTVIKGYILWQENISEFQELANWCSIHLHGPIWQ